MTDHSGHCARYLLSVAAPLREEGHDVTLLGNCQLDPSLFDAAAIEPAFTLRCEDLPIIFGTDRRSPEGRRALRVRHEQILADDLAQLTCRHKIGRGDILLFNSVRHWGLQGIISWLETFDTFDAPTVAVILHYTAHPMPNRPDPSVVDYRDAFARVAGSPLAEHILLMTDSEQLADEYTSIFPLRFPVLPIPHCVQIDTEPEAGSTDKLTIAFAGEARASKGFHLLPELVRSLREGEHGDRLHFAIQCFCPEPDDATIRDVIDAMPREGVTLYPEPLDQQAYEAFLASADIILIPYGIAMYHAQTSGVLAEAMSLGILLIVPEGTWMARQIDRFGGGTTFTAGDPTSLKLACDRILHNYEAFRNLARQSSREWFARHNGRQFIHRIEAAIAEKFTRR